MKKEKKTSKKPVIDVSRRKYLNIITKDNNRDNYVNSLIEFDDCADIIRNKYFSSNIKIKELENPSIFSILKNFFTFLKIFFSGQGLLHKS